MGAPIESYPESHIAKVIFRKSYPDFPADPDPDPDSESRSDWVPECSESYSWFDLPRESYSKSYLESHIPTFSEPSIGRSARSDASFLSDLDTRSEGEEILTEPLPNLG